MEITIKGTSKEIADLVLAVQGQQNTKVKTLASKVFSKFCDDFNLHDEEIDRLLEKAAKAAMEENA